ncbi:MAG: cyclic nucleotide-binding domain-containing protein [Deltaproteobacteria bacterium]
MLAESFAANPESLPPTSARVSIAPRSPVSSLIYITGGTDKGRARAHNEDHFVIDHELGLALVCDGMGGHAAGDLASALGARVFHDAVLAGKDQIRDYLDCAHAPQQVGKSDIAHLLQLAANAASRAIHEEAVRSAEKAGMGTTLIGVLVLNNHAFIVNVGDSRAYLLREGELEQLTRDHNVYNELIRRKKLRPEAVQQLATKNALTRALGIYEHCEAETLVIDVAEGDRILLCSDGLYRYFEPPEGSADDLEHQLLEENDSRVVQSLIDSANTRGGRDNITAVVMTLGKVGDYDTRSLAALSARREALANSPLFALLDERELMRVLSVTEVQAHLPGDTIIELDAEGGNLYVVLSGCVAVYSCGSLLAELGVGQHFGEMSLLRDRPRSAHALALQLTELLVIPREAFFSLLRSEHELGMKLLWQFTSVLADRLAETTRALGRSREELETEDLSQAVFTDEDDGGTTLRPPSFLPLGP